MPSVYRIGLVLLALVLLPAFALAAFALYTASEDEALLADLRDQQLETLLFSVNQHAWDVTNGWASRLATLPSGADVEAFRAEREAMESYRQERASLRTVLVTDTTLERIDVMAGEASSAIEAALDDRIVSQLLDRRRVGFRQLMPVDLGAESSLFALAFLADEPAPDGSLRLFVLGLDPDGFIEDVIVPKLLEVARGQFELGVFESGHDTPTASTALLTRADVTQTRDLWLLPGYVVGIAPGPDSVEVARTARLQQTLLLLVALVLVLLGGAVVVWRGVRREVELARLKHDFISNVSHELRTPLALIRMYAETLEAGRVTDDAKRQRYYRILSDETERLARMVNNVLGFSRIDAGKAAYAMDPVDLHALVRDILDRYALRLERDGLRVETDLQPVPAVRGDREALEEVLINLLDNAAKYGAEGGEVTLHTSTQDGQVMVDVADRGMGIPEAVRGRIFEPFFRAQPESADGLVHTAKGTGLGLALVQHIAEAHGGTITAEARPGGGSLFRLSLPASDA